MDLLGEPVLTISEHHLFHRQITELCERVGAVVRRDYEGTSLTPQTDGGYGYGHRFSACSLCQTEIRDKKELRVTDVEGINVVRNHALVWRNTSPVRNFYKQLAEEIREIIESFGIGYPSSQPQPPCPMSQTTMLESLRTKPS